MIEKINQILPINYKKYKEHLEKKNYNASAPDLKLMLKGQELLANSKLGELYALNKVQNYVPVTYIPAKSIDEAMVFAQNKLGINELRVNNLDVANYVNEALAVYKNKTYDKSPVYEKVIFDETKENKAYTIATRLEPYKTLVIPNNFLNDEYDYLFEKQSMNFYKAIMCSNISLTKNQTNMLVKAIENPSNLDIFEKMVLYDFAAKSIRIMAEKPAKYAAILGDGKAKAFYNFIGKKIPTVKQFEKLDEEKQRKILEKMEKDGFNPTIVEISKFKAVFHEIAHIKHSKKIGKKKFDGITPCNVDLVKDGEKYKEMFSLNEPYYGELMYISRYSQMSPGEFVAEAYAAMLDGNELSEDIMNMYKKYGGPIVADKTFA